MDTDKLIRIKKKKRRKQKTGLCANKERKRPKKNKFCLCAVNSQGFFGFVKKNSACLDICAYLRDGY